MSSKTQRADGQVSERLNRDLSIYLPQSSRSVVETAEDDSNEVMKRHAKELRDALSKLTDDA